MVEVETEEENEFKRKVKFKIEIKCPHCGFLIDVESGEKISKPAVKAEKEEYITIRKSTQSVLESGKELDDESKEESTKKPKKKPKKKEK